MNYVLTNWKTSLAGILGLVPGIVSVGAGVAGLAHLTVPGVTVTGNPSEMIINGLPLVVAGLIGLFAKDANVTGGNKQQ